MTISSPQLLPNQLNMPLLDADTKLSFKPLPKAVRQESCIGAEVALPEGMDILDLEALTEGDKDNLRRALFRYQVVVIRNQTGIDPAVIP